MKFQTHKNIFLAATLFPTKPVVRFLIPDSELGTIMEKRDTIDENDEDDNDDKTIGGKHSKRMAVSAYKPRNIRKKKGENCRRRNILQRDESIRKEVVRKLFFY